MFNELSIITLSVGYHIAIFVTIPITPRSLNLMICGSQRPNQESRSWLAYLKFTRVFVSLLAARPLGKSSDMYGRKRVYLFCISCGIIWFLLASVALFVQSPWLMLSSSPFCGLAGACIWIPQMELAKASENPQQSLVKLYAGTAVATGLVSLLVGLVDNFTDVPFMIYYAVGSGISLILLILALFVLKDEKPSEHSREFFTVCPTIESLNCSSTWIIYLLLFTLFWEQHTYEFDHDNFVNQHFHWSIFKVSILRALKCFLSLGTYFAYRQLEKCANSASLVAAGFLIKIASSLCFFASILVEADVLFWIGGSMRTFGLISYPILKDILASQGKIGKQFGVVHTLKSFVGVINTFVLFCWKKQLQEQMNSSPVPGLHFLFSGAILLCGLITLIPVKANLKKHVDEKSVTV